MTTDYERPGQRITSFGAGLLSGTALSEGEVATKLQENLQFRLASLRGMVLGADVDAESSPLRRRQEIMSRRRELAGSVGGSLVGDDGSTGGGTGRSGGGTTSPGSGRISQSNTRNSGTGATSEKDRTPSMSEVDKGTKKRANDRGFGT